MKTVSNVRDIPEDFVDINEFPEFKRMLYQKAVKGTTPAIKFLHAGRTRGMIFAQRDAVNIAISQHKRFVVARMKNKATRASVVACSDPHGVAKSVLVLLEIMDAKLNKIMKELGIESC